MEIKYGQGSQLIGHDMSKFLIEMEYKIVANPSILVTPMSNVILERIHQVLGNLVHTCNIKLTHVDEYDPRLGVWAAVAFEIRTKTNILKGYSTGKLLFGRDIIILIKNMVDWKLIRQKK